MKYFKFIDNNCMVFSNDERLNAMTINDFMLDDTLNYELLDTYRLVYVEKLIDCVAISFECDITYYLSYGSSTRKLYNFIKLLVKSYNINSIVDLLKAIEQHYLVEYQHQHRVHININDGVWCIDDEITPIIDWLKSTTVQSCIEYRDMTNNYHVASNRNGINIL